MVCNYVEHKQNIKTQQFKAVPLGTPRFVLCNTNSTPPREQEITQLTEASV